MLLLLNLSECFDFRLWFGCACARVAVHRLGRRIAGIDRLMVRLLRHSLSNEATIPLGIGGVCEMVQRAIPL